MVDEVSGRASLWAATIHERLSLLWAALLGRPIIYRVSAETDIGAGVTLHGDGPTFVGRTAWAGGFDETPWDDDED